MAGFDEDNPFAKPRPIGPPHEIGENVDQLSAPELGERIALLRSEIARLEAAIRAREATREAASAFFRK
jgi:uncharacterized small protein (DUF1192 family)